MESNQIQDALQAFYDLHPYPPPVQDLDDYRQRWQDNNRRRADFYLHWSNRSFRADLKVLVAGCGTSQAARHALRQPESQVVGIDISETSIRHTQALKRKYALTNLELFQLPIERVNELGRRFDKIVCSGVLHHLPDPEAGLWALREALEPDGALNLMVYAAYGRAGIYMIQEYCRRLGIGHSDKEIRELATTLTALPHHHPLAHLLGESPDFQRSDALADALLNPHDRAYTVPQLMELIERCGLNFGRWQRQAPYLAQCGRIATTPHAARLAKLPPKEQYAAIELFRGSMLRHNLILYHTEQPASKILPHFDREDWLSYIPIRLPEAINIQKQVPSGARAVLINQAHADADLFLPVDFSEMQFIEAINGKQTISEILHQIIPPGASSASKFRNQARGLFERLWWYDQVVFDCSKPSAMA